MNCKKEIFKLFVSIAMVAVTIMPLYGYANERITDEEVVARGIVDDDNASYDGGGIPMNAYWVRSYVDTYGVAPKGYCGGSVYKNSNYALPSNATYLEYDVYPKSIGRGSERLVHGSTGRWYYTPDHYQNFMIMD